MDAAGAGAKIPAAPGGAAEKSAEERRTACRVRAEEETGASAVMEERYRNIRIRFRVTPEEMAVIERKQAEANIINREAFLRKMVMEGRVLVLNVPELRTISALLGHCSGNLNQLAKRINSTGRYYTGELGEVKEILNDVEKKLRKVIEQLALINK